MKLICKNKEFEINDQLKSSKILEFNSHEENITLPDEFYDSLDNLNNKLFYKSFNFVHSNLESFNVMIEEGLLEKENFENIMNKFNNQISNSLKRLKLYDYLYLYK